MKNSLEKLLIRRWKGDSILDISFAKSYNSCLFISRVILHLLQSSEKVKMTYASTSVYSALVLPSAPEPSGDNRSLYKASYPPSEGISYPYHFKVAE